MRGRVSGCSAQGAWLRVEINRRRKEGNERERRLSLFTFLFAIRWACAQRRKREKEEESATRAAGREDGCAPPVDERRRKQGIKKSCGLGEGGQRNKRGCEVREASSRLRSLSHGDGGCDSAWLAL